VPSLDTRERRVSWRRILAGGILAIALTALGGVALERRWFGAEDEIAIARVNAFVEQRFDEMVRTVSQVSAGIAESPAAAPALAAGRDEARILFDLAAAARQTRPAPDDIAATIYDAGLLARAWTGMPSDLPRERIAGPPTLFVTPSPLGLRLVHVQPLLTADDRRVGTVATEHVLSPAPAAMTIGPADYTLATPVVPASLRTRIEGAGEHVRPGAVLLRAPTGEPLAEAWVDPADLASARAEWRRQVTAVILALGGCTILLLAGPLLDWRARRTAPRRSPGVAHTEEHRTYVRATIGALGLTAAGGTVLALGLAFAYGRVPPPSALLLVAGATAAAMIALLAGPVSRLRIAFRRQRVFPRDTMGSLVIVQLLAGAAVVALVLGYARLIELAVYPVPIDLRQFSIHPPGPDRLMLLAGVVATHLALIWAGALLLMTALTRWRIPGRRVRWRLAVLAVWLTPPALLVLSRPGPDWQVPAVGLVLAATACGIAALSGPRLAAWYRHATVAARIFVLFLAFLLPTLLLYPAMDHFAERAIRLLIETEYAVQAQNHVQTLLDRMDEATSEVDALDELPFLVSDDGIDPVEPTLEWRAAFLVWRQTVLARERLTSAVELYDAEGMLVSRFALNVPNYTTATLQSTPRCDWEVFGEVEPFGAEERRMLHAERRICVPDDSGRLVPRGGIILHVVLEYETLPFISSQNPYLEVFRGGPDFEDGTPAGNVEVAIYGWGLAPVYTSGRSAWPITDDLFQELYRSRDPFWADVSNGGGRHHVYFSNDRERIFAIGYPVLTLFDHFVHLAELTTFSGVSFALVLLGTALYTRIARARPRVGRALLREIRASFYRKLVLAFVLAAIIPVLALALVIRAYVETLLRADIEAEAARTAAIAQRVIEEADAPLRRSAGALGTLSDDVMVWISQVIDQDVNVFDGARLVATSERNLFASGVLPTRTPDDVYRAIVLERLPSFVRPDAIGAFSYMLAAAPVRAAGEDALVTVPLALRQREIEREIDELDRGIHLAALFFVLLGAGIGLSMAERIADPIRRLTRATGRIARGDFDARIAVKSADELRRLVDAFNSMAAELKAQRAQLERTHRLEAWAEMARQVAHEIKNPLTPIQLSAEHLQRVHADRGEPMGPVLESCVTSILGQVRLLRQISAEFSSFASAPTARPAVVDLAGLIQEVVDPYRTGLARRIEIREMVPAALPAVRVDRTLVARALVNIVENAVYAMPGAGVLTIAAAAEPERVVLTVSDTGPGMDAEALARVFEPYFSTKTTGTGLGLPIARRNIELNGGTVDVTSTRGAGTTVTVRLPRADTNGARELVGGSAIVAAR
jgi:signal transduction histidine kinase